MSDDLRWIGRPTPTLESLAKVRGRADFVTDLRLPRMLFGCVLRSPLPHARIAGLDTAGAARVRGTRAVNRLGGFCEAASLMGWPRLACQISVTK